MPHEHTQAYRKIKAALVMAGITQKEIADELGVTPTTVYQVLKGCSESARVKALVAAKLGFSPWEKDARAAV